MTEPKAVYSGPPRFLSRIHPFPYLYSSPVSTLPFFLPCSFRFNRLNDAESLMNVSGPSIVSALRQSSKLPSSLILVSDSLSHRVESLHLRFGGSANGHNGVKSVIKALGNDDQFYRLRVGIGKNEGVDAAEYVMRRLSQHERGFWGEEHGEGVDLVMREVGKVMRERVKKGPGLAELGI